MCSGALLSQAAGGARSYGEIDDAALCKAVCEIQQNRCTGRGGDLRGGDAAQYEVCAGESCGSTSSVVIASSPARFRQAEDGASETDTGLLGEYGINLPLGISHVIRRLPEIVENRENNIPEEFPGLLHQL